MCGIVGIYRFDGKPVEKDLLEGMARKINHRGPDDEGSFFGKSVGLWHKRLSILDLETGKQPIFNEDRTKLIVYNGEIYNFAEIKEGLLKKHHSFSTKTDTEVILHAYDEYGEKCVDMFNGMFAFVIYDMVKDEMFIARDRLGIKPFYYYRDAEKLVFASEIKAIFQDPSVPVELNRKGMIEYLMFQMTLDEKTMFDGIFLLKPGHYAKVSRKGIKISKYWDISFKESLKDPAECVKEFKSVFHDSVKRHLMSNVPLGAYLSGGFDSTSVVVTASKFSEGRFSTFTGAYAAGPDFDERPRSRLVAKKINAHLYERVITSEDYKRNLKKVIYHLDEPRVGSPAIAQYLVSELASKHITVCLTGHGGDELFSGYNNHKAVYFVSALKKNPLRLFSLLKNLRRGELISIGYHLLYPLVYPELKYGIMVVFTNRELKKLLKPEFYSKAGHFNPVDTVKKMCDGRNLTPMQKLHTLFLKAYLPSLFILEDKVSMASSIESRVPLCDNEMLKLSLSTPDEVKLNDNIPKYVIKEAMRDELPAALYKAKKMGFPTAFPLWYRDDLKDYVEKILFDGRLEKRDIFEMDFVRRLFDDHVSGKKNNECKLWSLISIEMWFRIFFDKISIDDR
jgi:asparagine synthase (glutamine-hydrolysing)